MPLPLTCLKSPVFIFCTFCFFLLKLNEAAGQLNTPSFQPAHLLQLPGARGFTTGEVKLLNGPFKESQDAEARYLLSLNVDRLLAPYLLESARVPKAVNYPGWETETLPGVGLCFYLSGTARLYAMTGNHEFLTRINYVITELDLCQQKNNGFLLGTKNGLQILEKVEKEGFFPEFGHWENGEATPYYSMEKLFSGLRDVYRICHNKKALLIAVRLGNWVDRHMSHISEADLHKLMAIEYGGMNWVLADLYADTGDKRFLQLSQRWQDTITVIPAVNGIDVLNGKHANMQFPKFSGLAARYPYTGNEADLRGAKFFWNSVVNHRSYVTGGNSESEYFGPPDSLSKRLSPFTTENCNEYNMLRLTKLLFEIEPRAEYADYLERTLFNHILASQNPADGKVCYYLPLMPGAERFYQPLYESFKCCVCSAMDSYTRHAEYIYSHSASGIFINLFIASVLSYKEKGIVISQETGFPDKDVSKLIITCGKPVKTDLYIRNPYWANNAVTIKINGRLQNIQPANGYFHIHRAWNNNDVVELKLPMQLRTESMPDDKNMISFFYGPVLLAANLSQSESDRLVNSNEAPALVSGGRPLKEWLITTGDPLTFATTVAKPAPLTVTPLYRKKTGPYSVYWQQLSADEWQQRTLQAQLKKNDGKWIDQITVDWVNACDADSGTSHHLTGTSTTGYGNVGILPDQCWRSSATNAFGYDLSVSDTGQNFIYCQYMGRQDYEQWNCHITVDGIVLKTLQRGKDDAYPVMLWADKYTVPLELTRGKKKIKLQFEPTVPGKMQMPRVTAIRILKTG